MDGVALSRELHQATQAAEERYLSALVGVWERTIRDSGDAAAEQFALVAAGEWQPPAEGAALTALRLAALAEALKRGARPIWQKVLLEVAGQPLARVGIAWDVKHPLFAGQLEKAAKRTGLRLGEAVQPVLRSTIADAYERGLGVPQTASLIRSKIAAAAPWQADMLARTDLNSLANGASRSAAALTGMHFKTWLATLDDKTRPEHADADGQTVPINDPFDVGGEDLDYPGDPAGSDAMVANCRCTLAYGESLDEAQGLLADGGTTMAHMTRRQRAKKNSRPAAKAKATAEATAEALVAGAVAVHHTPVVTGTWDGNAAMGRCSSAADYRSICAAFEDGADLSQRQAWHLPHHSTPNGPANISGVRNGLSRAPQTSSISASDRVGATAHLRAHLNDYNRRQGSNAILGLAKMSLEEALAAMEDAWGPVEEGEETLAAALPPGMDALPAGVSHCQMQGTPGYSGGGMCHMHNGSGPSMQSAMRKAQADARKKSQAALLAAARPIGFQGTAVIEGRISDDNSIAPRVILPDSLSWPEMPVPFMAQTVTAEGHAGAEVAGRVDSFTRSRGTGKLRNIGFSGELTTPFGTSEIAPMIEDKTLRYVSADLGASEWSLVDRKTFAVISQEDFDLAAAQDGAYALGCTSAKLKAVTLVPTQAIEGAMVALVAAAEEHGAVIEMLDDDEFRVIARLDLPEQQTLTASAAPTRPPRDWFVTPEPPGKMPLTVTEDGRVFGHLATWDSCHVGFLPSCVPPPKSDSSYAYFHVCELDTEDGETVTVGKLMFSPTDGGHADRSLSASKASAYYDRTGMAAAYLRVADGQHGIWAAGVLNPDLSDSQRQEMRRQLRLHPPSGDWRPINGQYELICALAVAVPGFPTPRATVTITAAGDELVLEEAIIASSGLIEADPAAVHALEQEGLVDEEMRAESEMRELVGRANWRSKLAEILGGDR